MPEVQVKTSVLETAGKAVTDAMNWIGKNAWLPAMLCGLGGAALGGGLSFLNNAPLDSSINAFKTGSALPSLTNVDLGVRGTGGLFEKIGLTQIPGWLATGAAYAGGGFLAAKGLEKALGSRMIKGNAVAA